MLTLQQSCPSRMGLAPSRIPRLKIIQVTLYSQLAQVVWAAILSVTALLLQFTRAGLRLFEVERVDFL